MAGYKSTCPKSHFGQVEHGDIWGTFLSILLFLKATFSYSEMKRIFLNHQNCLLHEWCLGFHIFIFWILLNIL
jgi:hypothetical protein